MALAMAGSDPVLDDTLGRSRDPSLAQAMDATTRQRDKVEFLIYAAQRHQEEAKQYLPRVLGNDASLTELDLQSRYVTDLSVSTLADALKANTTLTSLNLADNFIEHDGCMALADMLENNTTLVQINLGENDLDEAGALRFVEALRTNHTLNLVNLEGNRLLSADVTDEVYCAVKLNTQPLILKRSVESLRAQDATVDLRVLDLSFGPNSPAAEELPGQLDDFSCQALADVLRGNRRVEILRLRNNRVGDEGAQQLAWMLEDNPVMDELDLFGNVVGAVGCQAFIEVLTDHNNSMRQLNLQNNTVSENQLIELEWALVLNRQPLNLKKFIIPVRENDPNLVALKFDEHLSQRYYDDVTARILADALQSNNCVTSLELPNNIITEVGAHFLSDMLLVNTTLRHLDLRNNKVGSGSRWLGQTLKSNTSLLSLVLAGNQIEDADAAELADMLMTNRSLVELDLSNNRIKAVAGQFVASFHSNTCLQELFLEGNLIAESHMFQIEQGRILNHQPKALRAMIPRLRAKVGCPSDVNLAFDPDMNDRPLDDASAGILATTLEENYVVTGLNLSDNNLTVDGILPLVRMLDRNYNTLTHLNLSRNKDLGPDACELLADVFSFHKALTSLDISYNNLGDEGCHSLLRQVEKGNSIKYLNLEGCRCSKVTFRRNEVMVLANKFCPDLKPKLIDLMDDKLLGQTDLDWSGYTDFEGWDWHDIRYDKTAEVVAKALEGCDFFTTFRFKKNRISDHGCKAIVNLFKSHGRIETLDLSDNRITDAGAEDCLSLVKTRYEILHIHLEGNDCSIDKVNEINDYCQYNIQPRYVKELLIACERNDPGFVSIDISGVIKDHLTDVSGKYLANSLRKNHTVTSMNLANNHIALVGLRTFCDMLKTNTTIRSICLNTNIIEGREPGEALADMLHHNTTLESLYLRACEIHNDGALAIVKALHTNDIILKMDLRDNGLPEETMALIEACCWMNSQPALKKALAKIRANEIADLMVSGQNYDNRCVTVICEDLVSNSSVTQIDLSNNLITDNGARQLARAAQAHPALTVLNLSHNAIGVPGCEALAKCLEHNTVLARLHLGHNAVTPPGVYCFQDVMKKNSTLLELTFDGNKDLDEEAFEALNLMCLNTQPLLKNSLPPLYENAPNMTSLDFSRGQFPNSLEGLTSFDDASLKQVCTHTDVACKLLGHPLKENTFVTTLNFGNGRITDKGVSALSEGLFMNRTLHTLSLANNELTSEGARSMSAVLLCNTVLTSINLRRNHVADEGALVVLNALRINDTCRYFNLDLNPISDELQKQLGFAITLNNQPRTLKKALADMTEGEEGETVTTIKCDAVADGRAYDDISAQILADSLRANQAVTSLDLSNNKVTDVGGQALALMLRSNTTLLDLNLENNELSTCAFEFITTMKANTSLRALNLKQNKFKEYELEKINVLTALAQHPHGLKPVILRLMDQDSTQNEIVINCLTADTIHKQLMERNDRVGEEEDAQMAVLGAFGDHRRSGYRLPYLCDSSVKILAGYLKTDLYARKVNLAHNKISDDGAGYIADVLKANKETLMALNLSNNTINDEGFLSLAKAMNKNTALASLDFSDNFMSDEAGSAWLNLVKAGTSIKQLELAGNPLSPAMFSAIGLNVALNHRNINLKELVIRAMEDDPTLRFMDCGEFMGRGWWDADCVQLVRTALETNTNVTKLSFCFDDLEDSHMEIVIAILQSQPELTYLDLSNNRLTICEQLAECLKTNTTLTSLNLSYNKILPPEALEIGKMLRENEALVELDMSGNPFGEVGSMHLIEAVKYNEALETLRLEDMGLPQKMTDAIDVAVSECYKGWKPREEREAELEGGQRGGYSSRGSERAAELDSLRRELELDP
mmetsp:Transcript_24650/g.44730  ORF Transcript_24650/g.44730 Transcript_24650/m.44730 type:complete len:1868 (-) Transcript_24650:3021-8624(-)